MTDRKFKPGFNVAGEQSTGPGHPITPDPSTTTYRPAAGLTVERAVGEWGAVVIPTSSWGSLQGTYDVRLMASRHPEVVEEHWHE